jgi:hypothetical protein
MANQQQHQNPQRPGTDREWSHWPTTSPGQTVPAQGNQNPRDQSQKQNPGDQSQKQNPADQDRHNPREEGDQIPRDPSKIQE